MTNKEAVIWLINITADIGKAEHSTLWHYEQALSEIKDMLEEQLDPQWIPCKEDNPKEAGWYRVTLKDGTVNFRWYSTLHGWEDFDEDDVLAWMPLPTPYQERRTDD